MNNLSWCLRKNGLNVDEIFAERPCPDCDCEEIGDHLAYVLWHMSGDQWEAFCELPTRFYEATMHGIPCTVMEGSRHIAEGTLQWVMECCEEDAAKHPVTKIEHDAALKEATAA